MHTLIPSLGCLLLGAPALAQPTAVDTLLSPDPEPFAAFGYAVAAESSADAPLRLLVAAPFEDPEGAAYVLNYDPATGSASTETIFLPPGIAPEYGHAVALFAGSDGGTVVALSDVISEVSSRTNGRVHIFRRTGAEWVEEATLTGTMKPGLGLAAFGADLAGALLPSGEEVLFVGAANGGNDGGKGREGSAYAFVRAPSAPPGPNAWTMEARLLGPGTGEGDRFGTAVALLPTPDLPSGHPGDALALVGADYHPRTDGQDGAVYTLIRHGAARLWNFHETLLPDDLQDFDHFGAAVALLPLPSGGPGEALALIGAPGDDDREFELGAAYAFRREADASAPSGFRWAEEAKLYPARTGRGLHFGASVALAADTLGDGTPVAVALVGADPSGESGSHPGEAGLFVRTVGAEGAVTWRRSATFATGAQGPEAADWFGHAVALAPTADGPLALVGAYYSNAAQEQGWPDTGLAAGAVFVYDGRATVGAGPETPGETAEAASLTVRPNPARGAAQVRFTLAAPASVRVSAYDVLGRAVAVLHEGPLGAGAHALSLDTRRLAAGVYVVRVEGEGIRMSRTITVVR